MICKRVVSCTLRPTVEAANYPDSKCHWGYITLCDNCVEDIKARGLTRSRLWRHITFTETVQGLPLAKRCESCSLPVKPKSEIVRRANEHHNEQRQIL